MTNFKILTYCTDKENENFKKLSNKLSVDVLEEFIPWTSDFYAKSYSVLKTIQNFDDDLIILVCDAYDVLPLAKLTNEELFEKIKNSFDLENFIVFNAEKNCYPNFSLKYFYPENESIWKYLNAGIYVGSVKLIKVMLTGLLPLMPGNIDQGIFSEAFVNKLYNITLDYDCKVFQTLYMNVENELTITKNKITNNITNTNPILLHGNGSVDISSFII